MAVAYAISFGDVAGSAMLKGLIAAVFVWVLKSCAVLPPIGQGFAGYRVFTWLGMLNFTVAHTVFFAAMAPLYEWLRRGTNRGPASAASTQRSQASDVTRQS